VKETEFGFGSSELVFSLQVVPILLSRLQAVCPMTHLVLHEHPHKIILSGKQLLKVDWRAWWWRQMCVGTWFLSTPTSGGGFRDDEQLLLINPSSHHLP
jgi:hypothetical protein